MKITETKRCRECDAEMTEKYCRCGWHAPQGGFGDRKAIQPVKQPVKADMQCAYAHNGERCPIPGCTTVERGTPAKMYCAGYLGHRGHMHCLHDPEEALEVLRFVQKNYEAIMREYSEARQNWRDVLIDRQIKKMQGEGHKSKPFDYRAAVLQWVERRNKGRS